MDAGAQELSAAFVILAGAYVMMKKGVVGQGIG